MSVSAKSPGERPDHPGFGQEKTRSRVRRACPVILAKARAMVSGRFASEAHVSAWPMPRASVLRCPSVVDARRRDVINAMDYFP
jgi:hypothetical protein